MNDTYDTLYDDPIELTQAELDHKLIDFLHDPGHIEKAKFLIALTENDKVLDILWMMLKNNLSAYGTPDDYAMRELVKVARELGHEMIMEGEI